MIPLRLEIKNFLAYREADPLDLGGLHVVCLTGENGAGKSSLLDAVTWALWGKARSNRDDELISQGEAEMRVALVFSEGDNTYQVVRTRKLGKVTSKSKAPSSSGTLDFLVEHAGSWRTLTEPRQSDTQARIIATLNLTYDTFINSAYLKQGKADEFTLRTPAERKALLADILSLDVWLSYEDKVKSQQQTVESSRTVLQFELKKAEDEIARLPVYERELEAAQELVQRASAALERAEAELAELRRQQEQARSLRAQLAQAEAQHQFTLAEQAGLDADRARHERTLSDYRAAVDQRAEIDAGFAAHEAARARDAALNLKLSSLVELNGRKAQAEAALAEARRAVAAERDAAQRRVNELDLLARSEELEAQFAGVNEQLTGLVAAQQQRDQWQRELADAREQQAAARTENEELRRRMNDLKTRITALSRVGAICPTCGRELAEADRARILSEWEAQGRQMGDQYRANLDAAERLAAGRKTVEDAIAGADRALARLPGLQREFSALEERLSRAGDAAAELPGAQQALAAAAARLDAGNFAPAAQADLAAVSVELAQLGYDAAEHRQLREATLPRLQAYIARKAQLDRAEIGIESERRALESLDLRRAALGQRLAGEEQAIGDLRREIGLRESALLRAREVESTAQRVRLEFFAAQRKVGEASQRVQACRSLEASRDRLRGELDELARRQALLAELRTAFGKNGVPAMIIEAILPELEYSANGLLSRMTNGRMYVRFETQRQTQRGDVSETLDLRISDELGERPYEMFSGGEAFRINFAVRIALSRLLAHRAGARLQTLFIDEGFGTQDAQGRERLVEAIRSIQDDFERLVIITHIDELKDAFPARIEVTKSASGSLARVV